MECNEDGIKRVSAAGGRGLKRKREAGAAGGVWLAFPAAVPPAPIASASPAAPPPDVPFMSNMDEISYWVYTKRAPCLYNYDNTIKRQAEQAQCSATKPLSVKTKEEEPCSKRRKIKLLKDDSGSAEKQQNIFLKIPQRQKPGLSSTKSEVDLDIGFNIKTPEVKKTKPIKSQKRCPTRIPKKNKIVASTPKMSILRRSLRNIPQIFNNRNTAFDVINANVINGKPANVERKDEEQDGRAAKGHSKDMVSGKAPKALNGQLEDSSDVSGFTANYIRSTKIHSTKRPNKLRNQNRTLPKQSKQRLQPDKMIICVNKSMNTNFPNSAAQDCSADSSQNALKLFTVTKNAQATQLNKSTSLLKFMETKTQDSNSKSKIINQDSNNKLNISFQSRSSSVSRYPRRHKNNTDIFEPNFSTNMDGSKGISTSRKYNMHKGTVNMTRKENTEKKVPRTQSRKRRGVKLDVEETSSVIQLHNCSELVGSTLVVNMACPNTKNSPKNIASTRCLRSQTIRDKGGHFYKESSSEISDQKLSDSAWELTTPKCARKYKKTHNKIGQSDKSRDLRNKSGFAACFSDSDSDSVPLKPLKQRKFFC